MNKRWWHYSVGLLGLAVVLSAVIALEQVPWAPTYNPATGVATGAVLTESMLDTLFFNTKNLTDVMHSDGAGNLDMEGNTITNLPVPVANSDAATKAYVDAIGGAVSFAGYTAAANNGNMVGIGGATGRCDADYPGSHICTYDEIQRLGTNYPYTTNVWLPTDPMAGGALEQCEYWTTSANTRIGPSLLGGAVVMTQCNIGLRLACCN